MVVRAARDEAGAKADAKPATSKLLQSEVELGILTRHGERYDLSLLSLPCPVHLLQRGTGEALKASLDELIDDIPFLHSLQTVNSNAFLCGVSAADRAQANNKAENGIYYERSGLRLRLPCFAHTTQTAVGRSFGCIAADISGQVAMSLIMGGAGEADAFRESIAQALQILVVEILNLPPLPESHPQNIYLDVLLKQCLPGSDEGLRRAGQLKLLLTSDVRESLIRPRVVGGQLDVVAWSRGVAELLVPGRIRTFPRHRWCNSLASIANYALLGAVHGVLQPATQLWLGDKSQPRQAQLQWTLSESEDDCGAKAAAIVPAVGAAQNVQVADPSTAWVKFNKQQKAKARAWVAGPCEWRLMVALVSLQLGVAVLRQVEYIASDRWQMKAYNDTACGEYNSRMLAALDGIFAGVVMRVMAVLETSGAWDCLADDHRTGGAASLAFSIVYTQWCTLEQIILLVTRLSPFTLFELIRTPTIAIAEKLLSIPRCLRCEFLTAFHRVFPPLLH